VIYLAYLLTVPVAFVYDNGFDIDVSDMQPCGLIQN
jgi:hypothetical protein